MKELGEVFTPKDYAKWLVDIYLDITKRSLNDEGFFYDIDLAKQCALIAVDFAINSPYSFKPMEGGWISGKMYYEEVKKEIEKL